MSRPHLNISGSYGAFKADFETGEAFDTPHGYADIVRIDIGELKLNFSDLKPGDNWDVTWVGCWYDDGSYEPHESGRQAWLDNITHEDDLVRSIRASLVRKPQPTGQFIATVRLVVSAPSAGEACDFFSETLREIGLVDWGYIDEGPGLGFVGPRPVLGAPVIPYDEDRSLESVWGDASTAAALAVNANWQLSTGDVSVEATKEIH